MARQTAWVLALVLTCAPLLRASTHDRDGQGRPDQRQGPEKHSKKDEARPASTPGERERWKWWLYDRVELSITDKQSAEINEIFESTIPKLREARHELDRAEEELSRTIKEVKADIGVVSLQLDRVENARSQHNRMRTLMLYRIHLILSAEQRVKLEALRARQERERRERDRERDKDPSAGRQRRP